MRTIAALFALLLSLPASAQERAPSWQDPVAVPDPIPTSFCIEIHWSENSGPWKDGEAISIYLPPLDFETRRQLEGVRQRASGELRRCSSGNA